MDALLEEVEHLFGHRPMMTEVARSAIVALFCLRRRRAPNVWPRLVITYIVALLYNFPVTLSRVAEFIVDRLAIMDSDVGARVSCQNRTI